MISKELIKTLQSSVEDAKKRKHEYVTAEHILYAFTFDDEASRILKACGANLDELRYDLNGFLQTNIPEVKDNGKEPIQSIAFMISLQIAAQHSQSASQDSVTSKNVLVALYRLEESFAVYYLKKQILKLDLLC